MTSISSTDLQTLLRSVKFHAWRPKVIHKKPSSGRGRDFQYKGPDFKNLVVDVKHFSPTELAEAWGVSVETIRSIFREEPGVLKIGKTGTKYRRGYFTLRIPQEIAEKVHRRLSA